VSGSDRPAAGPRVVAIGGGHGLAATLRACAPWAGSLTAVVSTADDGGSTGRLRESWEVPAPGDVRRCLSTLGAPDSLWTTLVERRFDAGELDGHAVGNLLLLALTEELGSLQAACDELARLCEVPLSRARVVPVTDDPVVLCGVTRDGRVEGQVAVAEADGVAEVWVEPRSTAASPLALAAVADANLVVIGPGSLYTSVLAAAVVGDLRKAMADAPGRRAFVCNLRSEPSEARGYGLVAQVEALVRHEIRPDVVVCHQGDPVEVDQVRSEGIEVVDADVARSHGLAHDPAKLGRVLQAVV
jgi:uncharacterized cofD-like protein